MKRAPRFLSCLFFLLPVVAQAAQPAQPAQPADPSAPPDQPLPGERAFNSCVRVPQGRKVKVTLKPQTSLRELVGWVSAMTCKRFVFGGGVAPTQSVTLLAPEAITPAEAYRAFVAALEVMGHTVVPRGRLLRIVPANHAPQAAVPTFGHRERARLPQGADVVTQLLRVDPAHLDTLHNVLSQLVGRSGKVLSFAPSATLIVTDAADNVRRLVRIAEALQPASASQKIWVVRPRHADAAELQRLLEELQPSAAPRASPARRPMAQRRHGRAASPAATQPQSAAAASVRFVVDVRTNALVIVGDEAGYRRALSLVRLLDAEGGGAKARPWVVHLENGDASALEAALRGLLGAGSSAAAGRAKQRGKGVTSSFEGQVVVQAEKTNNALLVHASPRDFLQVREIIRQLDRARRQVFVEAYVLELSIDGDSALGVAFHGAKQVAGETTFLGGLGSTKGNSAVLSPDALIGLALGVQGPVLEGSGELLGLDRDVAAFGVMLQALAKTTDLDVLSAPHLLTTDNEEAEIFVGDTVPVKTGVSGMPISGAASAMSFVNVSREKVGIKLKLVPSIGKGEMVRLKIEQEASSVKDNVGDLGVATGQRTLKTMVSVPDGQTVVIGGLVREEDQKVVQKVPLLGDIPILGALFRHKSDVRRKTNLLLVLTPHVIRDHTDLQRLYRRKIEQRQAFVRRYWQKKGKLPLHEVDFVRGRGLLGEINRVGVEVEREAVQGPATKKAQPLAIAIEGRQKNEGP